MAAHTVRESIVDTIKDGVHDWPTDNPRIIIRTVPPTREVLPGLGLDPDPVIAYQVATTKRGEEVLAAARITEYVSFFHFFNQSDFCHRYAAKGSGTICILDNPLIRPDVASTESVTASKYRKKMKDGSDSESDSV